MGCKNSLDHLILRHFIGAGFDHDNFFAGRCHCQSQIGIFFFIGHRVKYKLAVHKSDLSRRDRAVKRNVRNSYGKG